MGRYRNRNLEGRVKNPTAKLAFAHRVLWARDPLYRACVMLGPAPLIGGALAAAIWLTAYAPTTPPAASDSPPPWAHRTGSVPVSQDAQPYAEPPDYPLPKPGPNGDYRGLAEGWNVAIQPMTINATMDANVIATDLNIFPLDQPTIPLSRILDAAPPSGLYAGVAKSFLVIRAPGRYAISLRVQRFSTQSVSCLARLGTARHRVVRNITLHTSPNADFTYPPTEFQLQPGLYGIGVAAACWRTDQNVADAEITVMIRHPGELRLHPALTDELMCPRKK
jgi:hypothetical protein